MSEYKNCVKNHTASKSLMVFTIWAQVCPSWHLGLLRSEGADWRHSFKKKLLKPQRGTELLSLFICSIQKHPTTRSCLADSFLGMLIPEWCSNFGCAPNECPQGSLLQPHTKSHDSSFFPATKTEKAQWYPVTSLRRCSLIRKSKSHLGLLPSALWEADFVAFTL